MNALYQSSSIYERNESYDPFPDLLAVLFYFSPIKPVPTIHSTKKMTYNPTERTRRYMMIRRD
jgi:hypothetical protein